LVVDTNYVILNGIQKGTLNGESDNLSKQGFLSHFNYAPMHNFSNEISPDHVFVKRGHMAAPITVIL